MLLALQEGKLVLQLLELQEPPTQEMVVWVEVGYLAVAVLVEMVDRVL